MRSEVDRYMDCLTDADYPMTVRDVVSMLVRELNKTRDEAKSYRQEAGRLQLEIERMRRPRKLQRAFDKNAKRLRGHLQQILAESRGSK